MPDLEQLLEHTSRTFALAIPLLPEPTRTDVTVAYLVFRIADTLEDAINLPPLERKRALEEFGMLLESPSGSLAFAETRSAQLRTGNPWYCRLVAETPQVLEVLAKRSPSVQQTVRLHAGRTAFGMASFLERGSQRLKSLSDLQHYCYCVAGIVGEMLTEIFVDRIDAFTASRDVRLHAKAFGEGLQLVNILKDSDADSQCGRFFLPRGVALSAIFQMVKEDLSQAQLYVEALRQAHAPPGYVAFARLPIELAWLTLDHVGRDGPGSKVSRREVARILAELSSHAEPKSLTRSEENNQRDLRLGASAT